jgi:hypothetical protein
MPGTMGNIMCAILVTNAGKTSTTFLVLQGIGEYDYVPLA